MQLHEVPVQHKSSVVSTRFFDLHYFCYMAPLKHCTEEIQLSQKLHKVLGQLLVTFFCDSKQLLLRRLWSKFKGALLTIIVVKDLATRARGPSSDVFMLYYVCSCCKEPFGVFFC